MLYVFWLEKREEKVLLSQKGALIDRNLQRVPYLSYPKGELIGHYRHPYLQVYLITYNGSRHRDNKS